MMSLNELRDDIDNYVADYYGISCEDRCEWLERVEIRINSMTKVQLLDVLCDVLVRKLGEG